MPGYSDPGFDTLALHAGAAVAGLTRAVVAVAQVLLAWDGKFGDLVEVAFLGTNGYPCQDIGFNAEADAGQFSVKRPGGCSSAQ